MKKTRIILGLFFLSLVILCDRHTNEKSLENTAYSYLNAEKNYYTQLHDELQINEHKTLVFKDNTVSTEITITPVLFVFSKDTADILICDSIAMDTPTPYRWQKIYLFSQDRKTEIELIPPEAKELLDWFTKGVTPSNATFHKEYQKKADSLTTAYLERNSHIDKAKEGYTMGLPHLAEPVFLFLEIRYHGPDKTFPYPQHCLLYIFEYTHDHNKHSIEKQRALC